MAPTFPSTWARALQQRRFLLQVVLTLLALAAVLPALSQFVAWIERRHGVVLVDPVLAWLPSFDLSLPLFLLTYGALALALWRLVQSPRRALAAVQAYVLLVILRMLAMWLIPLDPPRGLVPLQDPLASLFGYGATGRALTRDLFFSGHASMVALLAFSAQRWAWRLGLLLTGGAVGALVLLQHAHYSVDVLVAPLAALAAWRMARWLMGLGRRRSE